MAETYAFLRPLLDALGLLPGLLTLPLSATLLYLGKRSTAGGSAYVAFFLLDAAFRVSGNRLLPAQFAQIANLVELGQLDDALALKRWADGAVERRRTWNAASKRHLRCYLNGLLPLHWHEIRQQPGEEVSPLSIDYRNVPHHISGALKLNPALVARYVPAGTGIRFDENGVPILVPQRSGPAVPSVVPLRFS